VTFAAKHDAVIHPANSSPCRRGGDDLRGHRRAAAGRGEQTAGAHGGRLRGPVVGWFVRVPVRR